MEQPPSDLIIKAPVAIGAARKTKNIFRACRSFHPATIPISQAIKPQPEMRAIQGKTAPTHLFPNRTFIIDLTRDTMITCLLEGRKYFAPIRQGIYYIGIDAFTRIEKVKPEGTQALFGGYATEKLILIG